MAAHWQVHPHPLTADAWQLHSKKGTVFVLRIRCKDKSHLIGTGKLKTYVALQASGETGWQVRQRRLDRVQYDCCCHSMAAHCSVLNFEMKGDQTML